MAESASETMIEAPAETRAPRTDELDVFGLSHQGKVRKENQDRFQEIQASDMTPEQKAQAASALVDEQQKAIQESDSSGSSGDGGPN